MAYEVNGFAEAALTSYRQAERLDPLDARWPYYQALLIAHRGDLGSALAALSRSLAIDSIYAPAWLWRGTWLMDLDQPDEALLAFANAGDLGETDPAAVGRARVLLRKGDAQGALQTLQRIDVAHPYVSRLLGQVHSQLGNAELARQAYAAVSGPGILGWADPRSIDKKRFEASLGARLDAIRKKLTSDSLAKSELHESIQLLATLREQHPHHQGLISTLSEAYRQAGEYQRAFDTLREGLDAHPDYYPFHLNIAEHYIRIADAENAERHLDRVIALNPAVAWAHAQKGLLLLDKGQIVGASASFRTALEHEPGNTQVSYYLGMVEASRANWVAAAQRFKDAIEVDDQFTPAYIGLGQSLTEAGRFDEAATILGKAMTLATHPDQVAAAQAYLDLRRSAAEDEY
jgi:tetratricopeptide (TPR) repeat protein